MGNSKKPEASVAKGKKKYIIKAHTVTDAGATARGAIAITRNGLEAANGIHVRALKKRDAILAEAAEVKSSLELSPVRCKIKRRHALLPISLSGKLKMVWVII